MTKNSHQSRYRGNVFQHRGFPSSSGIKNQPAIQETQDMRVGTLGGEDPLEEGMATYFSTHAEKILWTEGPGRLQSVG